VRKIILSFTILFSFQSLSALEIKTPLDAVQALGHEMSEMRHMLETFAMIGTRVTFQLPKEQLKSSIDLYENVIANMEKAFSDDAIQKQIVIGRKGWAPVKQALEASLQKKLDRAILRKMAIFIHGNIRTICIGVLECDESVHVNN